MVTRKAFIKQDEDIILPITRAELVFDSEGTPALESEQFVATSEHPGLFTPKEKTRLAQALTVEEEPSADRIVQAKRIIGGNEEDVYPRTKAEAISININNSTKNLTEVINTIIDLDDYPTENSEKAVKSGGVWLHIDDTVGAIHRTVSRI